MKGFSDNFKIYQNVIQGKPLPYAEKVSKMLFRVMVNPNFCGLTLLRFARALERAK